MIRIKKYQLFISLMILSFSMVSCKKYLDVTNDSTISQDEVFNSVAYTSSAITGVYNSLMGDDGYGSRLSIIYPYSTDEFKVGGDFNPLDRRGLGGYGAASQNTELNNPFRQLYQGIERANLCIKYIPLSEVYSSGSDGDKRQMDDFLGQALTLRAWFYHELIRNWGDVSATFVPAADLTDTFLPKEDRDVVYEKLLADLAEAATLVPWRSESNAPSTRVTKATVKAIRARLALARGGYSLRRNPVEMIRRPDFKDFYQIALNETKEIIDRGENQLNPDYETPFRHLHVNNSLDASREIIFEVGAFGSNNKTDSKLGYANGPRVHANSIYGQANGGTEAIPTYFYEFDRLDTRRDVTIAFFSVNASNNKEITAATAMRDGKFRKYWTNFRDASQSLGINWPMIRYSDILLLYAEADNEINGAPSAAAISAYELVRKRAFKDHEDAIGITPTSYEGFFQAIVKERLLEFGDEGIRKYDLIRWNLLAKTIDDTRIKLRQFMNREGDYANVPQYIYFNARPLVAGSAGEETATMDVFGGTVNEVFYKTGPTATPEGYAARANWSMAINEDYITGDLKGYAIQFQPNRKELLPIFSEIILQNYRLSQDYGY